MTFKIVRASKQDQIERPDECMSTLLIKHNGDTITGFPCEFVCNHHDAHIWQSEDKNIVIQ